MSRWCHQASVRFSFSSKFGRVGTGVNAREPDDADCGCDFASVAIDDLQFHSVVALRTRKPAPTCRDGPTFDARGTTLIARDLADHSHRARSRPVLLTAATGLAYFAVLVFSAPTREGSSVACLRP